ncbi:MAG: AAA family ATPase [Chitinophagales bacterium]
MIFEFKNIGPIDRASIELGNLTLICGENNTGKTYLSYGIYGFFAKWGDLFSKYSLDYLEKQIPTQMKVSKNISWDLLDFKEKLEVEGSKIISDLYLKELKNIFSTNENDFVKSHFLVKDLNPILTTWFWNEWKKQELQKPFYPKFLDEKKIVKIPPPEDIPISDFFGLKIYLNNNTLLAFFETVPQAFILSPERFITRLFLPEIDKNRSDLVNTILQNGSNPTKETLEGKVGRYSLPIKHNIDFARDLTYTTKQNSFLQTEHPEVLTAIEDMLGIEYVVKDGRLLVFDKKTERMLPFDMASTSVRSLADLHLWLKHKAQKGNILFIDEPELSLHPANQIKLMRLLVRLVNVGIKIFMTTHSDYMVKELNNLLKLSYEFPNKEKVMEELGYQQKDILQATDLKAYITENQTTKLIEIDELGMLTSAFDDAIIQINESSNKLGGIIEGILGAM